ncbi:hypothetical protein OJ997_14615, partial [Solirubrobacter phytolaccae]
AAAGGVGAAGADAANAGDAADAGATKAGSGTADADAAKAGGAAKAKASAKVAAVPGHVVFAGATTGQLYRWTSADEEAVRLTAPKYRLETPTTTDDGFAAVHVADDARRLVRISADGTAVEPLAEGDFHRPVFSPDRGLLAVIAREPKGPSDAGLLCVLDPQDPATAPTCAKPRGLRVGRPAWAPNGRSVLALASTGDSAYTRLVTYAAKGGDATAWPAPRTAYRAGSIRSAAWLSNQRVAVLVADHVGAPAHLRVLTRNADGTFSAVKDFPALTGHELAATGRHVALRSGQRATGDGAITLLDVDAAQPRIRRLPSGVNPTWVG